MNTALVLESEQFALEHHEMKACVSHFRRGSQYTSHKCKVFCKKNGTIQSVDAVMTMLKVKLCEVK